MRNEFTFLQKHFEALVMSQCTVTSSVAHNMLNNKLILFEIVAIIKCLQQDNVTFLWFITQCWKSNNSPQMSNNSPQNKNIITLIFLPQKEMLMIVTIHFQCTERTNEKWMEAEIVILPTFVLHSRKSYSCGTTWRQFSFLGENVLKYLVSEL